MTQLTDIQQEFRARRLFQTLLGSAVREDYLNRPGVTSDNTLLALIRQTLDELDIALKAGHGHEEFDPAAVAILAARVAAHSYALARNNAVLNDIDLPEIARSLS